MAKEQVNFRVDADTVEMLRELAEKYQKSQAQIVSEAIMLLYHVQRTAPAYKAAAARLSGE